MCEIRKNLTEVLYSARISPHVLINLTVLSLCLISGRIPTRLTIRELDFMKNMKAFSSLGRHMSMCVWPTEQFVFQ